MSDIQEENQVARRSTRNQGNIGSPTNKFSPKEGEKGKKVKKGKDKSETGSRTPKSTQKASKDAHICSSTPDLHNSDVHGGAVTNKQEGQLVPDSGQHSIHEDTDDSTLSATLPSIEPSTVFSGPITDTIAAEVRTYLNSNKFANLLKSTISDVINRELHGFRVQLETAEGQILHLESELKAKEKTITNLLKSQQTDHSTILDLQEKANDAEQYQRRNCLRFYGIPESVGEDTNQKIRETTQSKLGITLGPTAIDRSHRVGPPPRSTQDAPRAIIVKFTQYDVRRDVLRNRRKLKGLKMGIDEDLTAQNRALLGHAKKAVESKDHLEAAWSIDGKIIVLVKKPSGKTEKKRVKSESDLAKL